MTCPACRRRHPGDMTNCREGRDCLWALAKLQVRNTFRAPTCQRWARSYLGWERR